MLRHGLLFLRLLLLPYVGGTIQGGRGFVYTLSLKCFRHNLYTIDNRSDIRWRCAGEGKGGLGADWYGGGNVGGTGGIDVARDIVVYGMALYGAIESLGVIGERGVGTGVDGAGGGGEGGLVVDDYILCLGDGLTVARNGVYRICGDWTS